MQADIYRFGVTCKIGRCYFNGCGGDAGCGVQVRAATVWAYQKGRESASVEDEGTVAELIPLPSGYLELLQELKGRIHTAQVRAGLAVSRELVLLYWSIGRDLSQRFATVNGTNSQSRLL
jgi:hypothetical protein